MLISLKILSWILFIPLIEWKHIFKDGHIDFVANNKFAKCFRFVEHHGNKFKSDFNWSTPITRPRNTRLASVESETKVAELGKVDSQYLSGLNRDLNILNNSISNNNIEESYNNFKKIFDLISLPISELYGDPVEVDYGSKLEELNSRFGLNLERIDPMYILKMSPYRKKEVSSDLSFEYITELKKEDGKVVSKLWKRELKEELPKGMKKQLTKAFNEFSKSMGNFMFRFYMEQLPMEEMLEEASKLGLQATADLFEGVTMLKLKNNKGNYELKKSLEMIDFYSNFEEIRRRSYNRLIEHFFLEKEPEPILEIFKYLTKVKKKKITSLYLLQYLVALAEDFKRKMERLTTESAKDEEYVKEEKKKLYLGLKEKIKESLELYKENHLDTFNVTKEILEIIEENYKDIVPCLFEKGEVVGRDGLFGSCERCNTRIEFEDISEDERFEIFLKLLETMNNTSPTEISDLYEFYNFLSKAKEEGNPYTCIIDGQNVGYSKNQTKFLDWFKMNYSFNFMKSMGENPLIVVPQRGIQVLLNKIGKYDRENFRRVNEMIQKRDIYTTNKYSYDDNFFLLSGIVTFSEREIEAFNKYLGKRDNNNSNNNNNNNNYNINNNNNKNNKELRKGGLANNRNTIILTNDRLSNLRIDDADKEVLERWKDYSLIGFNCYRMGNKEIFILGQRLKYTFGVISEGERFHIPIGLDRVFTNTLEIHRCTFDLKMENNNTKIVLNLYEKEETPIQKWIKNNLQHLMTKSYNKESDEKQSQEREILKNNTKKSKGKSQSEESDIFHKSPEIAKQMFSPEDKSMWLCVDLSAIDRLISNL